MGAAYRLRIAFDLKDVAYDQVTHDLRTAAQATLAYAEINPQKLVPALKTGSDAPTQSPAILEWLEETHPAPPLLPADPGARAIVRAMAAVIACDIHLLNNLRVLTALRGDLGASDSQVAAWIARWRGVWTSRA